MLEKYELVNVTDRYSQFKNAVVWEQMNSPEPVIYVVQASGYIRRPKRINSPRGGYTWDMHGHISATFPAHLSNWKEIGNRLLLLMFQEKNKEITKEDAINVKYECKVVPDIHTMIKFVFTT